MIVKFEIRLHLLLILSGIIIFGAIINHLLLMIGYESRVVRNLVVMLASYALFFVLIKNWISHLKAHPQKLKEIAIQSSMMNPKEATVSKRKKDHWLNFIDFGGFDGIDADGLIIIPILLLIGAATWIFAAGPTIMIDTAFELALSIGLIPSSRRILNGDWHEGVLKRSLIPFLIILISTTVFNLIVLP